MTTLNTLRQNGEKFFLKEGLPTKKHEDWKYMSWKNLKEESLRPLQRATLAEARALANLIEEQKIPECTHLVFVNGYHMPHLSDSLPGCFRSFSFEGLSLKTFSRLARPFRKARRLVGPMRQDAFEALNSARMTDGLFIQLGPQRQAQLPVQFIFVSTQKGAQYPRIQLHVGAGGRLDFIESHIILTERESFESSVVEVLQEKQSQVFYLQHIGGGREHQAVHLNRFFLKRDATLQFVSTSLSGDQIRNNMDVFLLQSGATAEVLGVTLTKDQQVVDNHTLIDHVRGGCLSRQRYKSVIGGESRAIFNGRVHIRQNSQKAHSEQLNNNLLLTKAAEANTKPQLEIHADDVKATHGSTVGQLNAEELFYFLSRGISRHQALEMLSLGFAQDILEQIENETIKGWIANRLVESFRQQTERPK